MYTYGQMSSRPPTGLAQGGLRERLLPLLFETFETRLKPLMEMINVCRSWLEAFDGND